eukprot:3755507-Lingulodinium_polyedra.AAC.1
MARRNPSSPLRSAHAPSTAGHHWSRCSEPASPEPHRGQTSCVLGSQARSAHPACLAAATALCCAVVPGARLSAPT